MKKDKSVVIKTNSDDGTVIYTTSSRLVRDEDDLKTRVKKLREAWKDDDIVRFNLSAMEFRHAIMGWCSFLIRPHVAPFNKLKHSDKFRICGEDAGEYICRVDDVNVFEDVSETVTEENYRRVWPDASLMSLDRVRYLASVQVYNNRYRQHIKKYGTPPKVMLIRYSLYKDPKH